MTAQPDIPAPDSPEDNVIYLESTAGTIINMLEELLDKAKRKELEVITVAAHRNDGAVYQFTETLGNVPLYGQLGLVTEAQADLLALIKEAQEEEAGD